MARPILNRFEGRIIKKVSLVFIGFLVWVQFLSPLLCVLISSVSLLFSDTDLNVWDNYRSQMLPFQCFFTETVMLVIFFHKYGKHTLVAKCAERRLRLNLILPMLALSFAYTFIDSYINDLLNLVDLNRDVFYVLDYSKLGLLSTCLLAPLAEELVFREYIEEMLLKLRRSPWFAIIVSSLFFGLMHINPSQVASAFTFGLLLGWLYYKFRSVTLTFCLHALNNIYCAMLDRWGDGSATTSELCRMMHFPLALTIVLSLAIFTFSIWCLDKIAHSE